MPASPSEDLFEIEDRLLAVLRDFHLAIDRLRDALAGERSERFAELKARRDHKVTLRQLQIIGMINEAPGIKNHQIATALGISLSTVKNTLHAAYRTLGVSSRKQAITQIFQLAEMIRDHETRHP